MQNTMAKFVINKPLGVLFFLSSCLIDDEGCKYINRFQYPKLKKLSLRSSISTKFGIISLLMVLDLLGSQWIRQTY